MKRKKVILSKKGMKNIPQLDQLPSTPIIATLLFVQIQGQSRKGDFGAEMKQLHKETACFEELTGKNNNNFSKKTLRLLSISKSPSPPFYTVK